MWWYRERAFVGFLSACIAARGGKFIQEYSFRKKGPGNIGRADLRLKTGAGSVYNLEAKHTFYTPRQKKGEIDDLLSEASGQLEKFDDGESKVAIVIITFRSVNEKSGWKTDKTDKIIAAIKQEFEKLNSHHYQGFWGGYIQASLNEGKARMYYSGGEDDAWYPGLCVIAAFGKNKGNCSPHHGKADPSRGTSKEEASQDDK